MFLDSRRIVFTFLSWLDLLGAALTFRISILKIFKFLELAMSLLDFSHRIPLGTFSILLPNY